MVVAVSWNGGRVGLVVPVSFRSSFKSRPCWICEPPSRVSLGVAPVGAIVSTSARTILQSVPQSKSVLDQGDAKPSSTSELGSMRCMQQESQQETDKLERYRDEHVPEEGEECSGRESLYDHFARDGRGGNAGREVDGSGLPIGWDSISLGGSVGRRRILLSFLWCQVDATVAL